MASNYTPKLDWRHHALKHRKNTATGSLIICDWAGFFVRVLY